MNQKLATIGIVALFLGLVAANIMLTGCGKFQADLSSGSHADAVALTAIDTAAVLAGAHLAEKYPDLVPPALAFYKNLQAGRVDAVQLNQGLSRLANLDVDPVLIRQVLVLAENAGARVDLSDGKILGLSGVSDRHLTTAVDGFFEGVRLAGDR
ncbi:MAG: hypothetical protein U5L07_07795 [Desulfobacterales bacterium]|nr:hypothetical protein [Desulfobacterales bacterium]